MNGKGKNINNTEISGSSIDLAKAADSIVHDLTVSVRPSLKSLVMEASYVKQNFPASLK